MQLSRLLPFTGQQGQYCHHQTHLALPQDHICHLYDVTF